MNALETVLGVDRRVTVAPWLNGTCERMMREVVRTFKAILQKRRKRVREWVDLVPVVQYALNTAHRERYASTPFHAMNGRAPTTSFSTLASSSGGNEWKVDVLDLGSLKQHIQNIIEAQVELHKQVATLVEKNRAKQRNAASRGKLPDFYGGASSSRWIDSEAGDHVDWSVAGGYRRAEARVRCAEDHLW